MCDNIFLLRNTFGDKKQIGDEQKLPLGLVCDRKNCGEKNEFGKKILL